MTPDTLTPGLRVMLCTPDNPRLDRAAATVERVETWGAHVLTAAAATGRYRAMWYELNEPDPAAHAPVNGNGKHKRARAAGYTGDVCVDCGGSRVVRNGSCLMCLECGATTGCN